MDWTIRLDDDNVAVLEVRGLVTPAGVEQVLPDVQGDERYRLTRRRILDARGADLSRLTREDFRKILDSIRGRELGVAGVRRALVVSRSVDFGVGRMFELTEGADLPSPFRVFKDMQLARSWLADGE